MTRDIVALALRSGIPVREWLSDPDPRILDTAFDLFREAADENRG